MGVEDAVAVVTLLLRRLLRDALQKRFLAGVEDAVAVVALVQGDSVLLRVEDAVAVISLLARIQDAIAVIAFGLGVLR